MERSGRGWAIWSLCGIGAWVGVTIVAAVLNDDPADAGPVTTTFAVAGAVFFTITFGAASLQMRNRRTRVATDLYRRLALTEVDEVETHGLVGIGWTYLFFGAATTGLMLLAIGLNDEDVFPILLWTVVALVGVWLIVMVVGLRRAFTATDAFAAPLGLRLVGTDLVGERHGRAVEIRQGFDGSTTTVAGSFPPQSVANPQQLGGLTGQPWTSFRRVRADCGPEGVVVERRGNGAGRWVLVDLLLAETLAG